MREEERAMNNNSRC